MKSDESWRPKCLGLYSSHFPQNNVSAMFWGCISYNGIGTLTPVQGNIDSEKYSEVLDQHLWPVIAKEFPNGARHFKRMCQERPFIGKLKTTLRPYNGHYSPQTLI